MPASEPRTYFDSLQILFKNGVRYSTIIDVGCADGHLCLKLLSSGIAEGARPLNIDPNQIYEDSLRKISEAVGGHYRICAITDHVGEVELTMGAHPYWASLRPKEILLGSDQQTRGACHRALRQRSIRYNSAFPHAAIPAEARRARRRGRGAARRRRSKGHPWVVQPILTTSRRSIRSWPRQASCSTMLLRSPSDGWLGWFIRSSSTARSPRPKAFWDAKDNVRSFARRSSADRFEMERADTRKPASARTRVTASATPDSRNAPCPCGSGLRYKHCHGANSP